MIENGCTVGLPVSYGSVAATDGKFRTACDKTELPGALLGWIVGHVFCEFFTTRFSDVENGDEAVHIVGTKQIVKSFVKTEGSDRSFVAIGNAMKDVWWAWRNIVNKNIAFLIGHKCSFGCLLHHQFAQGLKSRLHLSNNSLLRDIIDLEELIFSD